MARPELKDPALRDRTAAADVPRTPRAIDRGTRQV
jgi:hypothetical protein